jgi:phage shock protein E
MNKHKLSFKLIIISLCIVVACAFSVYASDNSKNIDADQISQAEQNIQVTKMALTINQIKLSVTSDGVIERDMDGKHTCINYNEQYAADVTFLKLVNWNNIFAALVYDNNSGAKKIITSGLGNVWSDVELTSFAYSDIQLKGDEKFDVNDITVYGDQIFAGCNDGILLTLTPCIKCYKLKKICNFDIMILSIDDDTLTLQSEDERYVTISIGDVRQNNIQVEAALELHSKGALLIDVRTPEEYNQKHYQESINIPLSDINRILEYDKNTVLIFFCERGIRAQNALEQAKKMGFLNVYNLGSVDKLLER